MKPHNSAALIALAVTPAAYFLAGWLWLTPMSEDFLGGMVTGITCMWWILREETRS